MKYEFQIPPSVKSDQKGYDFFGKMYHRAKHLTGNIIILNFEGCVWFEANLCSILGSVLDKFVENKNEIEFLNLVDNIKGLFSRNLFLFKYNGNKLFRKINSTTIYYAEFNINDELSMKNYVEKELLDKPDMPIISPLAKKEIITSIFEIFVNAITHGECDNIYTCGQFYNRKRTPFVYFTFVDVGKTIQKNVNDFLRLDFNGVDAIDWAASGKNTTKTGKHSGGLGLKVIQDFIKLNKGKLHIISANGFWELNIDGVKKNELSSNFPGTIVTLAINLDKAVLFKLANEDFSPTPIYF